MNRVPGRESNFATDGPANTLDVGVVDTFGSIDAASSKCQQVNFVIAPITGLGPTNTKVG
jgi:hypothetical protein